MTEISEELPDSKRIITPLRLIFWGIIIGMPHIQIERFAGINDLIGTFLILWGVVSLSRVPISVRYQRYMHITVVCGIVATIALFFGAVLYPLYFALNCGLFGKPPSDAIIYTLFAVHVVSVYAGSVMFVWCMKEYSSIMNWESVIASWQYSIRLMIYGVGIFSMVFAISYFAILASLEFFPAKPPSVTWTTESHDNGGTQYIASRNGEIIYTSEIIPLGASFAYPSHITPVEYYIGDTPSDAVRNGIIMPLALFWVVVVIWTIIHILMSLSRMIHAAKRKNTLFQVSASLSSLHLRLWKRRRQRG